MNKIDKDSIGVGILLLLCFAVPTIIVIFILPLFNPDWSLRTENNNVTEYCYKYSNSTIKCHDWKTWSK